MKNYFFTPLIFITFILIACDSSYNSDPKSVINDKKIKILIDNLTNKNDNIKHIFNIINIHKDNKWVEDSDQFNMQGKNQLFDVTTTDDNIKYKNNKLARREVYLAFEYHTNSIKEFGKIANKLAEGAIKASNTEIQYLKQVINQVRQYARNYFLVTFTLLMNKQNKLNSLSLSTLKKLTNKFKILENTKQEIKNAMNKIKDDFNNDHNKIKTGDIANLIKYLTIDNKYHEQFQKAAIKINYICEDIKSILDKR
ncbi:virulence associated lipoprotein [Borrelia parkeri]|uniref:virulence associated lipoprotein n=1 Tax=Borrelia parkeri TaxID=141 RepID=UPI0003DEE78F|nr:virulence associated lipoprotein [Borrelia parkeri]AHF45555.1 hypothetical protein X966_p0040 [Borrelia parkeri HR1]UPA11207.1 hypothetical protein bpSLO_001053 [Borrelia parkeri]